MSDIGCNECRIEHLDVATNARFTNSYNLKER